MNMNTLPESVAHWGSTIKLARSRADLDDLLMQVGCMWEDAIRYQNVPRQNICEALSRAIRYETARRFPHVAATTYTVVAHDIGSGHREAWQRMGGTQ